MNTLIGVIIGFLLSMLKEYYYYRPVLVINKLNSSILPYGENNKWGEREEKESIQDAHEVEVKSEIQIYNKGRQPTAIKNIGVSIKQNGRTVTTSYPRTVLRSEKGKREEIGTSFNLAPGTIENIQVCSFFEIGKSEHSISRYIGNVNELNATIKIVDIRDKVYEERI